MHEFATCTLFAALHSYALAQAPLVLLLRADDPELVYFESARSRYVACRFFTLENVHCQLI